IVVLDERVERRSANTIGHGKPRLRRRTGRSCKKRRQRWECNEAAGSPIEVVIAEPSDLAAKLQGMSSMNPRKSVAVLHGGVAAALRKAVDSSEPHDAGHVEVWKNGRTGVHSKVLRVVFADRVGYELDVDPVCPNPQLVGNGRTEYMRITQRKQIAACRP